MNQISRFDGEHSFLSNFYPAEVVYEGIVYKTSEHAFQAAKAKFPSDAERIRAASTPGQAKREGRRIQLRDDWEAVKLQVMYEILCDKFTRHPDLCQKLLATGDTILIEGNNWGDRFWGVDGTGENHLGKTLMHIRSRMIPRSTVHITPKR